MNLKTTLTLATAATLSVLVASDTIAGTAPLAQGGAKRKVQATVNTDTGIVATPTVSKKVENTVDTWVPAPEESVVTEFDMTMQQPWRPVIPVVTALISLDCNGNGTLDSIEIAGGAMDWTTTASSTAASSASATST